MAHLYQLCQLIKGKNGIEVLLVSLGTKIGKKEHHLD